MRNRLSILLIFIITNISAQRLERILEMTLVHNPKLKAIHAMYRMSEYETDKISLPQPKIGIGVPIQPIETRIGAQSFAVGVQQTIPWFGTLRLKRQIAHQMSQAIYSQTIQTWLNISTIVKQQYYQSYLTEMQIGIITKNINLYQAIYTITLSKIRSGESLSADALRVQLQITKLKQQKARMQNQQEKHRAILRAQISIPDTLMTIKPEVNNDIAYLKYDEQKLLRKLKKEHPSIVAMTHKKEVQQLSHRLNNKHQKPNISMGIDYIGITPRTDANPTHNGRDAIIPKLTLTIPIHRKQYRATQYQIIEWQEKLEMMQQYQYEQLASELKVYKISYDNALQDITSYKQQLQYTTVAYKVLLAAYSAKGVKFDELLTLQTALFDLEIQLAKAKIETYLQKTNIEKLINY